MSGQRSQGLVLAVHPTTTGFGWVVFEGALAPVVWGIASTKDKRNSTAMRRYETVLNQYHPSVVVLEAFKGENARRGARIQELAQTMSGFAANRDIEVAVYSREFVSRNIVGDARAKRHAVARAVVTVLPIFRRHMPPKREVWQSEDSRQCLFDAVALAITHYTVSQPDS